MATLFLRRALPPLRRSLHRPLYYSLGVTTVLAAPLIARPLLPHHLAYTYADAPATPIGSRSYGSKNSLPPPEKFVSGRNIRQITTGSVLGLVSGVVLGFFSKTLVLLVGVGIVGVQFLESKGIPLVPYGKIQKMVKNVDVKSWVRSNPVLKIAFGATFALAAFAEF